MKFYRGRFYTRKPILDRFLAKFKMSDHGCWLWEGATMRGGYGMIMDSETGIPKLTHRLMWETFRGPIPEGLFVCHSCDNRACIRLDHLFLGTPKENAVDMVQKGRYRGPAQEGMGSVDGYYNGPTKRKDRRRE